MSADVRIAGGTLRITGLDVPLVEGLVVDARHDLRGVGGALEQWFRSDGTTSREAFLGALEGWARGGGFALTEQVDELVGASRVFVRAADGLRLSVSWDAPDERAHVCFAVRVPLPFPIEGRRRRRRAE